MKALDSLSPHAHWLVRIAVAAVFIYHGLDKFTQLNGMAQMMGLPVAVMAAVALAETAGGVLILAGGVLDDWVTRLGGLLLIPVMLGAISMVHWPRWPFTPSDTHPMGGMEFQVTLLLVASFFVIYGNGGASTRRSRSTAA